MRKSTSILIEEDFDAFIYKQVANGHYESAGEVVEAGLRLLKKKDEELEELRAALIEGEESGIAEEFDSEQFLKRMREKHAAQG